jgi:SAM-dependent methyltransferase
MTTYDDLAQFYFERRADKTRFDYDRDIEVPGMLTAVGGVKDLRVLDEGCGFGDHLSRSASRNAQELVGLDASKELITFAKRQNIPKSRFIVHDLNEPLPFEDEYFDKIFTSLTVFYVKNLPQLFAENYRVLKPGGRFCFSIFHPVLMLMNTSDKGFVGTRQDSQGQVEDLRQLF